MANPQAVAAQELQTIRQDLKRRSRLSSNEIAAEDNRRCPYCKTLLIPYKREYTLFGEPRVTWCYADLCGCPQEAIALSELADRERTTRLDRERLEYLSRLQTAGLVGKLSRYTFDAFDDRVDWSRAADVRAVAMSYSNALIAGRLGSRPWLILQGAYGTGKSHLAAAIVRRALDAGWSDSYFRVWTRYIERLQAAWNTRRGGTLNDEFGAETEADIVAELERGRLVVIDDIDAREVRGDGGGWMRSSIYTIFSSRYNAELPTVITLNREITDPRLGDIVGRAVVDRIIEHAYNMVDFDGPSYRLAMAVEGSRDPGAGVFDAGDGMPGDRSAT